jgi:hypothetical protein
MIHKRSFLYVILILIHAAGMGGEHFSAHAHQARDALRLWILSTDGNYQNARMVAFDLENQQIVEEIKLPPGLTVISATWSPDENYIAAIVGGMLSSPAILYGEKVCVFSGSGELVLCHEEPLLLVGGRLPMVVPTPIVWSADNQQLVFVTSADAKRSQQYAHIVILDVKHRTVIQNVEIGFPGIIHSWEWLGSSLQAIAIVEDLEPDTYQLCLVEFQPELSIELLTTYTTPSTGASLVGTDNVAFVSLVGDYEGHSVDVMSIEDSLLVLSMSLELVEYQGAPVPVGGLALSNNGDLLAFTSWVYLTANEPSQTHLFVIDFETEGISLIGGSPLLMEQLTWSPDDTHIAAKVCAGAPVVNTQCRIEVFSLDGTAISVDTGLPENRDPMWVSIES